MTAAQDRIRRANALDAQRNAPAIALAQAIDVELAAARIAVVGLDRTPAPASLFASLRLVVGNPNEEYRP